MAVALDLATSVGMQRAAEALNIPRATLYRAKNPTAAPPGAAARPTPPRGLTAVERQAVLEVLHSERFVDVAPKEVYATLLDEKVYHGTRPGMLPAARHAGARARDLPDVRS